MFNQMRYTIDGPLINDLEVCESLLLKLVKEEAPHCSNDIISLAKKAFFLGAETEGDWHCPLLKKIRKMGG